jgi:hypothetical protein
MRGLKVVGEGFVIKFRLDVAREGLMSWLLCFLGRPGPLERAEEVRVFDEFRTGDESLEGYGEFDAEVACAERIFFEL